MTIIDHLALFILLALVAEIIGTVAGFGSSLFFIPIASYFMEFHVVLGITAIFHVSSNVVKIFFFRSKLDKRILLHFGIPSVMLVIAGAFLSRYIDSDILELILAFFLITISALLLIKPDLSVKPTLPNAWYGGILSGFAAGLMGTGGAIRGLVLSAYNLEKTVFIATSAVIDLGIDFSRSVVYIINGYVDPGYLYILVILLFVSILGTYIGRWILTFFSQEMFKRIVLVAILIVGVVTGIQVISH